MPPLTQIVISQWENHDGRLISQVYALAADGAVYKFVGVGWTQLPHKNVTRYGEEMEEGELEQARR